MKRGIIIGVVAVVAVLGIGVFVLYSSLGDLIKAAIERVGSEATQASVTLDGVDLDATSGKGALRGFKVGNPKGFETPAAFTLGSVSLHVDAGTVTSDPVVIKEIVIAAALTAGNACVVKTPELDPLTGAYMAEAAEAAGLPAGAVNILCGLGPEAGAALVAHAGVDQIVFTGSVETGKSPSPGPRPTPSCPVSSHWAASRRPSFIPMPIWTDS